MVTVCEDCRWPKLLATVPRCVYWWWLVAWAYSNGGSVVERCNMLCAHLPPSPRRQICSSCTCVQPPCLLWSGHSISMQVTASPLWWYSHRTRLTNAHPYTLFTSIHTVGCLRSTHLFLWEGWLSQKQFFPLTFSFAPFQLRNKLSYFSRLTPGTLF